MNPRRQVLTTGDVAKLCNVAPRTVSKWFDTGQLRGYRIPGSKDRRIPLDALVRFMRAHDIPLNGLAVGTCRVLVLDSDAAFAEALLGRLNDHGEFEARIATSAFEAGAVAFDFQPHAALVDIQLPDVNAKAIADYFRAEPTLRSACLIATGSGLTAHEGESLVQQGFDTWISKPFDLSEFISKLDEHAPDVAIQPADS